MSRTLIPFFSLLMAISTLSCNSGHWYHRMHHGNRPIEITVTDEAGHPCSDAVVRFTAYQAGFMIPSSPDFDRYFAADHTGTVHVPTEHLALGDQAIDITIWAPRRVAVVYAYREVGRPTWFLATGDTLPSRAPIGSLLRKAMVRLRAADTDTDLRFARRTMLSGAKKHLVEQNSTLVLRTASSLEWNIEDWVPCEHEHDALHHPVPVAIHRTAR